MLGAVRVARLVPFYEYDDATFFCSDGAPPMIEARFDDLVPGAERSFRLVEPVGVLVEGFGETALAADAAAERLVVHAAGHASLSIAAVGSNTLASGVRKRTATCGIAT